MQYYELAGLQQMAQQAIENLHTDSPSSLQIRQLVRQQCQEMEPEQASRLASLLYGSNEWMEYISNEQLEYYTVLYNGIPEFTSDRRELLIPEHSLHLHPEAVCFLYVSYVVRKHFHLA